MTEKRFNMNKSGDLYDKNNLLMLNFGYSYDGVGCKRIIDLLNELNDDNGQLKHRIVELQNDLNNYSEIFNELNCLIDENEELKSENKRLTDKLNKTALELVDGCISQGKATEISEMSYREFLDYRAKNGKPMELQL